ncbi:MAG: alginate export family protein [Planctomycetota bacterium]
MSKYLSALVCATIAVAATTAPTFAQDVLEQSFYDALQADLNPSVLATDTEEDTQFSLTDCCEPSCGSDDACGCGDGVGCGAGVGAGAAAGPGPCAKSHKGLFYANDFSYLNDPKYNGHCLGDALKLMPLGDFGTLDIGGQLRLRYHGEVGMGREGSAGAQRFTDTNTDFLLSRLRLYANWKVSDRIRFYVEGIHAEATDDGGDYFARPIDVNRGDFLNLFVDLKLTDTITARVGRQELLYGAQRTVSPLDWANTRRTFEGARILYNNGNWSSDTFWTAFVPVAADDFDEADYNRRFYGNYTTYKGFENATVDAYYLGFDSDPGDYSLHTIGLRALGSIDSWLWEFEGGPQFGRQSGLDLDHAAGFATAGIGRKMSKLPGGTTIWFYYDYASGESLVADEDFNGFNQLFPLAHKYLGFIDAVQRSNIESPNILITMKPGPKWNFLMWYYHLMSSTDGPVPGIGNTNTAQNTSKDLGDELDIILKYTICPRSNVLFGWSHFWVGNKLAGQEDADFVYGQYTLNF